MRLLSQKLNISGERGVRVKVHVSVRVASLLFGLCVAAPFAASQDAVVVAAVAEVGASLEHDFALPDDLRVPPALRAQFESLRNEHRMRAKELTQAWAEADSAKLSPEEQTRSLKWRLLARYLNEVALWHLDTLGPDYEQRMLKAISRPGVCAGQQGRSILARVAWLAAGLDAAEQAQLVADQRTLLVSRWGSSRAPLAARPEVSVQARAEALLQQIKAGQLADEPPLPPVVTWALARSPSAKTSRNTECPLHQWWLRRELTRPDADWHAAFVAMRFADVHPPALREETADTDYPLAARRFGVEGVVRVRGRAGPNGLLGARVVGRTIRVPGLVDQRPVAFEAIFDAASLERAASVRSDQPQGQEATMEFEWKLTP